LVRGVGQRAPHRRATADPGADPERRWLEETVPQWREKFPEVRVKAAFLGTPAASSMLSWEDDVELVILGARRAADALVVLDQVLRGQGSFPVIVTKDSWRTRRGAGRFRQSGAPTSSVAWQSPVGPGLGVGYTPAIDQIAQGDEVMVAVCRPRLARPRVISSVRAGRRRT
jgi:hypothetical protein